MVTFPRTANVSHLVCAALPILRSLSHLSLRKHRPILRISIESISRHFLFEWKRRSCKGTNSETSRLTARFFVSARNVTERRISAIFFHVGPRILSVNSSKKNLCQTVAPRRCATVKVVVLFGPILLRQTARALFRLSGLPRGQARRGK
jgi:hypothetical protein